MSYTARWSKFFTDALRGPKTGVECNHGPHPLDVVMRKYPNVNQVETVESGLYSILSTNVHYFSSQYTVLDCQPNELETDSMEALAPMTSNVTAEGMDWEKERER